MDRICESEDDNAAPMVPDESENAAESQGRKGMTVKRV